VVDRLERHSVTIIAIVALVAYGWVYTRPDADPPIRSDGYNYYLYAASWVVYHDVTLEAVPNDWNGGAYPNFAGMVRWSETDHWVNRIPIGVSVLMLPFVYGADLITRWSNLPRDGYSFFYQHAAALPASHISSSAYGCCARCCDAIFRRRSPWRPSSPVTFGTNLFHYAVNEATFSHAFSFGLVAALVNLCDAFWRRSGWHVWHSIALGIVAGLIVLVRHTNLLLLLIVPLWRIDRLRDLWSRRADFARDQPGCRSNGCAATGLRQMGVGIVDRERLRRCRVCVSPSRRRISRSAFQYAAWSVVLGAGALGGSRGFGRRARLGGRNPSLAR
jgi:hypothetical protein